MADSENLDPKTYARNPNNPNASVEDAKKAEGEADGDAGAAAAKAKSDNVKSDSGAKGKLLKAVGAKSADVLSYNDESKTLVTAQGGKYQMSADGKRLIHLAGPAPVANDKASDKD